MVFSKWNFFLVLLVSSAYSSSTSTNSNSNSSSIHSRNHATLDHCLTSVDCSMNGECIRSNPADVSQPGVCDCFDGWKGNHCDVLDVLPIAKNRMGLKLPNNVSTWGGSVMERDGIWHMFASQMVLNCGLDYWTTNSQVIRATSNHPLGPYTFQEVILPTFSHDANVIEAPTGEVVLFVTHLPNVTPRNCTAKEDEEKEEEKEDTLKNSSTTDQTSKQRATTNMEYLQNTTVPPKDSYMLWAPDPTGPWSEPVKVIDSIKWDSCYWKRTDRVAHCDTNLNGIIHDDGSFWGLWRKCETENLLTIPHRLIASDWKNASTYQPQLEHLFVLGGSGAEDPSQIWTTTTSDMGIGYHAIFHDEQATRCMLPTGCSGNGRHAFSLDGKAWRYSSTNTYSREIEFDDGMTLISNTRARPHMIVDKSRNGRPIALSTGVEPTLQSDYVWTAVQPLRGIEKAYLTGNSFGGVESKQTNLRTQVASVLEEELLKDLVS